MVFLMVVVLFAVLIRPAVTNSDTRSVHCMKRQDSGNPCSFECLYGSAITLAPALEKLAHENSRCRHGMLLRIDRSVSFDNRTMTSSWFAALDVRIIELEIFLDNIDHIQPYAFQSFSFVTIETLTLNSLSITNFVSKTFSGLDQLKTLQLYQLRTTDFPTGWLSDVSDTLEYLLVYGMMNQPHRLNGLTNGADMKSVRLVTYSLNLYDSIDANTFSGLSAVLTLELSTCAIEYIGAGAFDPIASTIRLLKLNHNKLKRLPVGLFDKLLPSQHLNIYLSNNPFDCTCYIDDFQRKLIENTGNFIGSTKCNTPYYLNNVDLENAEFCVNGTEKNNFKDFYVRCYNDARQYSYVLVQRQQQQFRLSLDQYGDLILHQYRTRDDPLTLIVHTMNRSIVDVSPEFFCLWNLRQYFKISVSMQLWNLYTFCVMDPEKPTLSPMDCSSYWHRNTNYRRIWIRKIDKQTMVLLSATITVLSFFGGICVGWLSRAYFLKCKPAREDICDESHVYVETSDMYEESSEPQSVPPSRRSTCRFIESLHAKRLSGTPSDVTYVYQSKFDVVPLALPQKPSF